MRKTMTHVQAVALGEKLRTICETKCGVAVYAEGWDDARVVREMGDAYSDVSVRNLRAAMFGPLPKPSKPASIAELQARIERLEEWAAQRPVQGFRRT